MTEFLIGAALLLAVALAFLLLPLLRKAQAVDHVQRDQLNLAVLRDQLRELEADREGCLIEPAAYDSARYELERRVAEEALPQATAPASDGGKRWTAVVVGAAVPVVAVSVYLLIGSPEAMDPAQQQVAAAHEQNAHEVTAEQIEGMVASLAARLQNEPDNVEGWSMLARSYHALGRYQQSAQAYARLVKLVPNDAGLLADYADTLAMASNRSLQGEPEALIERAVALDSSNVKALALWASAAFARGDYANAIARWQKIQAVVPADSDVARAVSRNIGEAQSLMGQPLSARVAPAVPATTVAGIVEIAPALRAQVADSDTVFIFARAGEGPGFPLAVLRKPAKELPIRFVLDDSMSMTPDARLSGVAKVVIGARISKSGSATPSAGDLEGVSGLVAMGSTSVKVVINNAIESKGK